MEAWKLTILYVKSPQVAVYKVKSPKLNIRLNALSVDKEMSHKASHLILPMKNKVFCFCYLMTLIVKWLELYTSKDVGHLLSLVNR